MRPVLFLVLVACIGCSGNKEDCTKKGFTTCTKQCDGGFSEACYWVGEFLFDGTSGDASGTPVAADKPRALTYYRKACDGKVDDACIALAYAYVAGRGTQVDVNRAVEIAEPVCSRGRGKACSLLVTAAETAGIDPSTARARAVDALKKECDIDKGGAAGRAPCWQLAVSGWLPVDEAMKYAKTACSRGESDRMCKDDSELRTFLSRPR